MAKTRVFVSSTFFDLKHVRDDVDRFIRELGYEPVRFEKGEVPYGKDKAPESYSYNEVDTCDIFVTIIGSRYGSSAVDGPDYSVTQLEIKRAINKNIPTYIFIEKNVLSEFSTYELNKESDEITYKYVDNVKIFHFIDFLNKLKKNNPITGFDNSEDITEFLRVQWSGLFQRFLKQQKRIEEIDTLAEMRTIADTLHRTLNYISTEKTDTKEAIQSLLSVNHPVFLRFTKLTKTKHRIYFSNQGELEAWLRTIGWTKIDQKHFDKGSVAEWFHPHPQSMEYIKLTKKIFDEKGYLIPISDDDWEDDWLTIAEADLEADLDEIPF